jgi:hypothetical protein
MATRYDIALGKVPATIDDGQERAYKEYQKTYPVARYKIQLPPEELHWQDREATRVADLLEWRRERLQRLDRSDAFLRGLYADEERIEAEYTAQYEQLRRQAMIRFSHPSYILSRQQVSELGLAMPNPYPTSTMDTAEPQ